MSNAGQDAVERRDAYHWRLFGTGLSFAVFGLFGLVLGLLTLPVLRLLPGGPQQRQTRARATIAWCFRCFIGLMQTLGVITYEITGGERLGRPGQLIVANHPSLIDVVFLIGFTPGTNCIVKQALWQNPFVRGVVSAARYISNRTTGQMIGEAVAALEQGQSLIMFPEGTRTRPGQTVDFHRGAANVAVKSARTVTPVYIWVRPTTLTKADQWYQVPSRRPHWRLIVGDDLELPALRGSDDAPAASRRFNAVLRETFEKELARGDA